MNISWKTIHEIQLVAINNIFYEIQSNAINCHTDKTFFCQLIHKKNSQLDYRTDIGVMTVITAFSNTLCITSPQMIMLSSDIIHGHSPKIQQMSTGNIFMQLSYT